MENKLSKKQTKIVSEYYLDSDWTEGRMWNEARYVVDQEIKESIGYPIY